MTVRFIVSLLFAILIAIFSIQNSSVVEINFLFAKLNISQALVILISTVFGAVLTVLLGAYKQIKSSFKLKELNKKIANLEEENQLLRNSFENKVKDDLENSSIKDVSISNENNESI